jgi:hypothetical protein
LEPRLRVEAINNMRSLKAACRSAFECRETVPSATQQQVSETLRILGLSVELEVRCPKSGYSIDMLVHALEIGGERNSGGGSWAVEFDGPSHFLASGAPTGATLLKRRHMQLLGHALVSVPYWEWDRCQGAGEREKYLRGKLKSLEPLKKCGPSTGGPKQEPTDADVAHRETPAREGHSRAGVESGGEEQRKLREQVRKSKAGADVWEVRESKKRKRPYWFNRRTGESTWEDPLSNERVGARRMLEEGCG